MAQITNSVKQAVAARGFIGRAWMNPLNKKRDDQGNLVDMNDQEKAMLREAIDMVQKYAVIQLRFDSELAGKITNVPGTVGADKGTVAFDINQNVRLELWPNNKREGRVNDPDFRASITELAVQDVSAVY